MFCVHILCESTYTLSCSWAAFKWYQYRLHLFMNRVYLTMIVVVDQSMWWNWIHTKYGGQSVSMWSEFPCRLSYWYNWFDIFLWKVVLYDPVRPNDTEMKRIRRDGTSLKDNGGFPWGNPSINWYQLHSRGQSTVTFSKRRKISSWWINLCNEHEEK